MPAAFFSRASGYQRRACLATSNLHHFAEACWAASTLLHIKHLPIPAVNHARNGEWAEEKSRQSRPHHGMEDVVYASV